MGVEQAAREIGLWWPSADEDGLRRAALAWDQTADALDRATQVGRSGGVRADAGWSGAAAERFAGAWHDHERALADDAAGCRALARSLRSYADAVADAKRRVEELAVTAGATIVAGVGLAWLTFGTSTVIAAGVGAGLVAAAEAIGVELSATAASIVGGAVAGVGFGAADAAVVDMAVTQPVRVAMFHDGGYSTPEAVGSAVTGGVAGGLTGGILGGVLGGAPGRSSVPAGAAPRDLRELDGVISAALDPAHRGALGPLFRSGVHETPTSALVPVQRPAARLLAAEGHSVHPRAVPGSSPGALVRSSPSDPGRLTELACPDAPTPDAIENAILEAGGRLDRHGAGDLVLDGRSVGLSVDAAGEGLATAVDRATTHGLALPESIRFVFDTMSIHYP